MKPKRVYFGGNGPKWFSFFIKKKYTGVYITMFY